MFGDEQRPKKANKGKTLKEVLDRISDEEDQFGDDTAPLSVILAQSGRAEITDKPVLVPFPVEADGMPSADSKPSPQASTSDAEAEVRDELGELQSSRDFGTETTAQGVTMAADDARDRVDALMGNANLTAPASASALWAIANSESTASPAYGVSADQVRTPPLHVPPLATAQYGDRLGSQALGARANAHLPPQLPPIPARTIPAPPPASRQDIAYRTIAEHREVALTSAAPVGHDRLRLATSLGFGLFVAAGLSTMLGMSMLWLIQSNGNRDKSKQEASPVTVIRAQQVPTLATMSQTDPASTREPEQNASAARILPDDEASLRATLPVMGSGDGQSQLPKLGVGRVEYRSQTNDWAVPIEVDTAGTPHGDLIVAITDLPAGARLNKGRSTADGSWFIEPGEIEGLTLKLPENAVPERIAITLVTGLGKPLGRAMPKIEGRPQPLQPTMATPGETAGSRFGKNHDEDSARSLFDQGEARLHDGDVIGARMLFTKAANAGDAQAAIAIGATYDPSLFATLDVKGMKPDREMARRWYQRAIDLGSKDAYDRLERLGQN